VERTWKPNLFGRISIIQGATAKMLRTVVPPTGTPLDSPSRLILAESIK
jgi:hypothetical protein